MESNDLPVLPPFPVPEGQDVLDKSLPDLPEQFLTPEQLAEKREREQKMKEQEAQKLIDPQQDPQSSRPQIQSPNAEWQTSEPEPKKAKRKSWLRYIFNCRCLGCGFLLLLIGSVVGLAVLVVVRPPVAWEPVKEWLNAGLVSNPHDGTTLESAKTELEFQLRGFNVGENDLVITESQLKPLINARLKDINAGEIHTDIQPGKLKLYWNIVPSESTPLWLILELAPNGQKQPVIDYLGFQRFPVPSLLNQAVTKVALAALNITGVSSGTELVSVLLPLPNNVKVAAVEFEEAKMIVTLDISTGLDSVLQF